MRNSFSKCIEISLVYFRVGGSDAKSYTSLTF